jgi:hypothetical protein
MRVLCSALLAVALLEGQTVEERLRWARESIDAHAVSRFVEPPDRESGTKWSVTLLNGCSVGLKETWQRTAGGEVTESRVINYTFDLRDLRPGDILADTSTGKPQLKIFAPGDIFHLRTDFKKGGRDWSTPGSARNIWMTFDSPMADNRMVVRRLERDLRDAAGICYQR